MHYLLLILIALIWGSQYIFNAVALEEFTPFGLMVLRIAFGLVTLSLLIILIPHERKQKLHLTKKLWGLFILIGAVEAAIPFFLIGYGQLHVSSSVTAIVMGVIPMMTILLELLFRTKKRVTKLEIVGLSTAFMALLILINPNTNTLHSTLLGLAAVTLAAFCFALALILMAKIPKEISALHATRAILLFYTLLLLPIWFYFNHNNLPLLKETWGSVIVLGIFSSGIVYLLYLTLIRQAGASFTALSNFLVPIVGAVLGVRLFHEPFTLNIVLTLGLIIFSLFLLKKGESS